MDTIWPDKSLCMSKLKRYLEPRLVVITLALPIDHTLVSPNIKVLSRLVWSGSDFGSDHNLVLTRLWLSDCEKPI